MACIAWHQMPGQTSFCFFYSRTFIVTSKKIVMFQICLDHPDNFAGNVWNWGKRCLAWCLIGSTSAATPPENPAHRRVQSIFYEGRGSSKNKTLYIAKKILVVMTAISFCPLRWLLPQCMLSLSPFTFPTQKMNLWDTWHMSSNLPFTCFEKHYSRMAQIELGRLFPI